MELFDFSTIEEYEKYVAAMKEAGEKYLNKKANTK